MKHEETYTSTLHTHVHFFIYEPQVIIRVKAVLFVNSMILMKMHQANDHFANFMCDKGYVVVVMIWSDMVIHLADLNKCLLWKNRCSWSFDEGYASSAESDDGTLYRYTYYYIGTGFGAQMIREYARRLRLFPGNVVDGAVSGVRAVPL